MTLLEKLQAHRGGLLRLKSQIYSHGSRDRSAGWDGRTDRICLVLDAEHPDRAVIPRGPAPGHTTHVDVNRPAENEALTLLLVDGRPKWIWVAVEDIELLDGGDR